jgi:hypothetical protein
MPRSSKLPLSLRSCQQNPVCTSAVLRTCHIPCPSHSTSFLYTPLTNWYLQPKLTILCEVQTWLYLKCLLLWALKLLIEKMSLMYRVRYVSGVRLVILCQLLSVHNVVSYVYDFRIKIWRETSNKFILRTVYRISTPLSCPQAVHLSWYNF